MADDVKHIPDDVSGVISNLRESLESYRHNIHLLNNLISSINYSNSWKDQVVKSSFIDTANSYINGYENTAQGVEIYIKFLESKSSDFDNLESRFS